MKESFLHFIWELQYFVKKDLQTNQKEKIEILSPGTLNTDAGPDFLNAKIRIGEIEWVGNIEIHKQSSDWFLHHHQHDQAYGNVILHVVYKHDKEIFFADGTIIPAIELQNRIAGDLILKYSKLVNSPETMPCSAQLPGISSLIKFSAKENALFMRLQRKSSEVRKLLVKNKNNWEETTYQLLARNFGFKVNADPFFRLSAALPLKVLGKHKQNIFQLEALLFGQAALLDKKYADEYPCLLNKEYEYLSHKYSLSDNQLNGSEWKFLRTRPANFPSIRIAEFAALIHKSAALFSSFLTFESVQEIYSHFKVQTSGYWHTHYIFDKAVPIAPVMIGKSSIENIAINTIVPLLVCYSKEKDDEVYLNRAISILESLPAENNKITSLLTASGLEIDNGFDSQAAVELYNNYCKKKNCLNCNIGADIIKIKN